MRSYYASLQGARGFAAIAVLLYHVWQMAKDNLGRSFAGGWFSQGSHGVDFFFVLSGFIILHANREDIGVPSAAPRYFYRRLVRIYPILILLTVLKLAYMIVGGAGIPDHKRALSYILCSTMLVPLPEFPFLSVSWTLCFEMFFYGTFLLCVLYGTRIRWWMAGHAAGILVFNLPWLPPLEYPASFFFSPYILDFYLGCITAFLCAHRLVPPTLAWVCVAVGGLLSALCVGAHDHLLPLFNSLVPLCWGLSFFFVITGIAALEQNGRLRVPRPLAYLGDASYSIYLVHNNIILAGGVLIAKRLYAVGNFLSPVLFCLATVTLLVSLAFYHYVERPMLRWLQHRGPRPPEMTRPPPSELALAAP